ncbi:hypothetical protein K4F52_001700 [Lecanicillium sp. MT-2017a]|nr:hypothetical protein K4F52_001700 [Lecanicillium sp. MT-2017a]
MPRSSSPLKAKVAIRDQWEDKESPAPQAISDLKKLLGKSIQCDPDFEAILANLDAVYEDKEQFVTAVTSSIKVWCQALSEVLESTDNEAWTDKLLERLNESGVPRQPLWVMTGQTSGATLAFPLSIRFEVREDPEELFYQ